MQNPGNQNTGNSMDFMWIAVLVIAAGVLVWYFYSDSIIRAFLYVKLSEASFIQLFTTQINTVIDELQYYINAPQNVKLEYVQLWLNDIGDYFRIPVTTILVGLAGYLYFLHPSLKFNTVFDMKSLKEAEKENWPQITPVTSIDLVKTPINEGPWAMALSPMEFAKKYKLLEEIKDPQTNNRHRNKLKVKIIEAKATTVFSRQMGPVFQGVDKLPVYMQALFGIFAAKALQDRTAATALLEQIARSAKSSRLDFSGAKELALKYENNETIQLITKRHTYVYGVMASMLLFARTDGVFASADFLWLKPIDRHLWYMLNNIGRQTPVAEVAGPFAHWLAERKLGRKVTQPMIKEAVKALEEAVQQLIYRSDNELVDPLEDIR